MPLKWHKILKVQPPRFSMSKSPENEKELRFMLLQESVWNNGDKLSRVLEHVISHEASIARLTHLVEMIMNRLGVVPGGDRGRRQSNG